jgi:hypothetical protein
MVKEYAINQKIVLSLSRMEYLDVQPKMILIDRFLNIQPNCLNTQFCPEQSGSRLTEEPIGKSGELCHVTRLLLSMVRARVTYRRRPLGCPRLQFVVNPLQLKSQKVFIRRQTGLESSSFHPLALSTNSEQCLPRKVRNNSIVKTII